MERLRVVLLAHGRNLYEAIPLDKFLVVGDNPDSTALKGLAPDVVLVAAPTFPESLEAARDALQQVPGTMVLIIGPNVGAQQVIEAVRLGVRDVLIDPGPADIRQSLEAVWQARRRSDGARPQPAARLIAVHSPKGGSGKSVLAANLAGVLAAETGDRTVLVDLALGAGDLDLLLNVKPKANWADLARCGQFGTEELATVLLDCGQGVHLLPAPAYAEDEELIDVGVVDRTLGLLRSGSGYVVVDTASFLDERTLRALELADRILVPLPLTLPALRRGQRAIRLWGQLGIDTLSVQFVSWDQRGDFTPEAASKLLHRKVSFLLPYDPRLVEQSLNTGELPALLAPAGAYGRAVRAIARSVSGAVQDASRDRRPGVLDWLIARRRKASNVSA